MTQCLLQAQRRIAARLLVYGRGHGRNLRSAGGIAGPVGSEKPGQDLQARGQGAKRGQTQQQGSAMSIDIDTARKVAKLARIRVEEADLPDLAQKLSGILGFMEQLNEVNVDGVEPMTSVTPMRLKRRADVVTDGNIQAQILKNAPDAREGFFAVPKVVE
jgi:aspartyl-tRNA(Asn)/glutamyl-tRNA(Gln) amidotransferase subunit C